MKIVDVTNEDSIIRQIAEILIDGFRETGSNDWTTLESATAEVLDSLGENRISRVAIDESGDVAGWIGGIEEYNGKVWELHPLVVRRDCQKKGIGRALVEDLEREVKMRGGSTITLGTDDENNRTSLGGVDLYPKVLENLSNIKNLRRHPFEFYQKLGYVITGVIPDANGFGKPDILMCKRVL
ncbi:MAG: GNAT family N-acetyltransferase [Acidobacteriota bacterium]|nr:GNAT family N-acetyltransferase [Acidobacteriota bacterium]